MSKLLDDMIEAKKLLQTSDFVEIHYDKVKRQIKAPADGPIYNHTPGRLGRVTRNWLGKPGTVLAAYNERLAEGMDEHSTHSVTLHPTRGYKSRSIRASVVTPDHLWHNLMRLLNQ